MTDTPAQTAETQGREKKSAGRVVTAIVRILLGLMFLVFGLNGFLNFMPAPKDLRQEIITVSDALLKAGYMTVVSSVELLVALLLLTNRFVPLALALLAPIIVGILTFHIYLAPASIGPGILVLLMELYLAWAYRGAFRPMLEARTTPGTPGPKGNMPISFQERDKR
jgi:uncharacterized membrane protein YphA (DoxX/SURF4 family)